MIKKESRLLFLVCLEKVHEGIPFGQAFLYVETDTMKEANDIAKAHVEKEMAGVGFPCVANVVDTAELNMIVLKRMYE